MKYFTKVTVTAGVLLALAGHVIVMRVDIDELRAKEAECEGVADDLGACANDLLGSIADRELLLGVLQGLCAVDGGVADGGEL